MNKLLIVALLAAAGLLAWLVLVRPEPAPASGVAASEAAADRAAGRASKAQTPQPSAVGRATPPETARSTGEAATGTPTPSGIKWPTAASTAPGGLVVPSVPPVETVRPPVVGDPNKASPWGRTPGQGMVEAPTPDVKDTLRRYWGNLPKSGAVPPRITVEELLPRSVIAALNVPPDSVVTMVGDYPVTNPQSFKSVLEKPDTAPTLFGITVVTPDGKEIRDYVRLNPKK